MAKTWITLAMAGALAHAQAPFESRAFSYSFMAQRGGGEERAYERGQRALDKRNWDDAAKAFAEAAAAGGTRADGALYWKAYALGKLGRRDEARAVIKALLDSHPNSRWLDDAKALELELRQAAGQPPSPDAESDDDLKLMALNVVLNNDPERAIPILEKIVKSSTSPKLKERALFVLAQSNSQRAKDLLAQIARGGANPDLQLKAINYLVVIGGKTPERLQLLSEIYTSTADLRVKKAVLQGFMVAHARDRLLEAAKNEKNPDLRREAVSLLGASGGTAELWALYRAGGTTEEKKQLLNGLFVGHDFDHVLEIARTDQDKEIRRSAIRSLGAMGGDGYAAPLTAMYASETDTDVRRAIIDAFMIKHDAKSLVELARKETNPQLKRAIVERLSNMHSKEATDYMLELLNK